MTTHVRVRRRLLHWRPRWRGPKLDPTDADLDTSGSAGGGFSLLEFLDDLFAAVLVLVSVALVLMAVVPAIVLVLEVVLVGVVAALGFLGRAMLGRPWTIEVVADVTGDVLGTWQVHGFRHAGAVAAAIEEHVNAGGTLPDQQEVLGFTVEAGAPVWPTT